MKILWLMIWIETHFLIVASDPYDSKNDTCNVTSQPVVCTEMEMGLTSSSAQLPLNVTTLYLCNNNIAFTATDNKILQTYVKINELYLSDNFTELCNASFSKLSKLNKNFQWKMEDNLHMRNLTLDGNSWNCNCSLLSWQKWLKSKKSVIANKTITMCVTLEDIANISIYIANIKTRCLARNNSSEVISASLQTTKPANWDKHISTVSSKISSASNTSTQPGIPSSGESWKFLVGVVVVVLTTTLLILLVVKFPAWYKYVMSYNHQRLKEDTLNMFEEEFTTDMNSFPKRKISNREEDDSIVVFEQVHGFAIDDDGFIEDRYIDMQEMSIQN
ncbi:leucine-rich repeat-containing protein 19 [Rhinatrema bivittatum]|uniref:leucine-rich repeat-containing protein 19 n=1 Tax=Rhinatrema bivittatum TaxID=194408 RepID=UPI00112BBDFD|nr:leucine-rich repeat-containing protein 19 [Rhinatrema bivittatum]XP_029462293.1 leucine-rich repeat-containing protein 19 [Rhinatrema bivittatum]XP_029462304.1 leucine-rich repeat-containing protein 19 [Rhinatrema bivittatum]